MIGELGEVWMQRDPIITTDKCVADTSRTMLRRRRADSREVSDDLEVGSL